MNNSDLNKKLKELKTEDYIWVIYIGIIFLSWYSNNLERKYYLYNDLYAKEKYKNIMILIFSILIIVYIYFFKDSLDGVINLKQSDSNKTKELNYLSLLASTFILLSGIILLYIALNNDDLSVEIAFN